MRADLGEGSPRCLIQLSDTLVEPWPVRWACQGPSQSRRGRGSGPSARLSL